MDLISYVLIIFATALILFILRTWLTRLENKTKISEELMQWLKDMGESNRQVDRKLTQNMDMFNQRLDNAANVISSVQKSIGEFSEIGRSMQQLQEFLQSPKLRGNIGEQVLKELLAQSLPQEAYSLQYEFKNGQRVDAVVKTSQGLIAIDSKFPLSSFKNMMESSSDEIRFQHSKQFVRDVKKHISSISQKYILASEGTLDYALMYIPSESVYYEIINQSDLYDFSTEMRIVPVSPMSFYAYLKVILISHEGARIQKQAKEILITLQSMKKDYEKTDEAFSILNKHIGNAFNQSNNVAQSLNSLGQKIESTSQLSSPEGKMIE
ncbi:MAG: DNA recombination protein RmuC [Candidatus Roizmanbacteria bacterium]|nr:DNA recombination protein RmuC [Candidatus Roizmanbacteria bacterium]